MISLKTLGSPSILLGASALPKTNQQAFAALLYLVVERGKPVARRMLAELIFADSQGDGGAHSLRQLIYRIKKLGVGLDADAATVSLPIGSASWDVEALLEGDQAGEAELTALQRGYLWDFDPPQTAAFAEWLDEHRSSTMGRIRRKLMGQLARERSERRFRATEGIARACLAMDPLNEEATLALAESMACAGAKAEALRILDSYLDEVGGRSGDLKVAPRILRERISEYIVDGKRDPTPMIGRDRELSTLLGLLGQAKAGTPRVCVITGPSGIGKTRLLTEASSVAAIEGHAVVQVRLHSTDPRRPFSILRDLAPALLDLPGALGASPEAVATVRGLCGRGPSQFQSTPTGSLESQAITSTIHAATLELIVAVSEEQPLLVCIEDAHNIDAASLELLAETVNDRKSLAVLLASQRPLTFPRRLTETLLLDELLLPPIPPDDASALVNALFRQSGRISNPEFIRSAIRTAGGSPFNLELLFRDFLTTGDVDAIPPSISATLENRLEQVPEPARSVFDALVVLGPSATVPRMTALTDLPKYQLAQAFRTLDISGLAVMKDTVIVPSHDLFALAARRRMSVPTALLLHRAAAEVLESDTGNKVEPLLLANHWEACGEGERALEVVISSAQGCLELGRPREAMELLESGRRFARTEEARRTVDLRLLRACRLACEYRKGSEIARELGLLSGGGTPDLQVQGFSMVIASGQTIEPYIVTLEQLAADRTLAGETRAAAGKVLMMHAEDVNNASSAERWITCLSDISEQSIDLRTTRLIYEVAFGDHDAAIQRAEDLWIAAFASDALGLKLEGLINSVLALWRSGAWQDALRRGFEVYEVAKREGVQGVCIGQAGLITEIYLTLGDSRLAREWHAAAAAHIAGSAHPERAFHYFASGIRIALDDGDHEEATRLLDVAQRMYPRLTVNQGDLEALGLRTRIRLISGKHPSTAAIEDLLLGYKALAPLGVTALFVDTLLQCLRAEGRDVEANDIRDDYLHRRRDRCPIPKHCLELSGAFDPLRHASEAGLPSQIPRESVRPHAQ